MDMPAEAVNAIRLLWGYYLAHVAFLVILIWPAYAFMRLKYAIRWSAIMLALVLFVEMFQGRWPVLGDADLNDIAIGWATVIIFSLMAIPIRMKMRITWKKETKN